MYLFHPCIISSSISSLVYIRHLNVISNLQRNKICPSKYLDTCAKDGQAGQDAGQESNGVECHECLPAAISTRVNEIRAPLQGGIKPLKIRKHVVVV